MKEFPIKSLITAVLLSTCLSLFFYFGILFTYKNLPGSILLLLGFTILCFLIFWINMKYEQYLDVNEVFYKTIAKDFKIHSQKFNKVFTSCIRPLNPYLGFLGTVSGLLLMLWALPALIIYLTIHPAPYGTYLRVGVFIMSAGTCLLFLFLNRDGYASVADKAAFIAGMLLGTFGFIRLFS